MGPLKQLLGLLPGVGSVLKDAHIDDKQFDRVEAIINSMTKKERQKPDLLDNSRRKRIAQGAGVKVDEISQLVKQFTTLNKLSKQMAGMTAGNKIKAVKELGNSGMGGLMPGMTGLPNFDTRGSSRAASVKSKFKKRKR
jgi:signal recognition particle subunit SRP54